MTIVAVRAHEVRVRVSTVNKRNSDLGRIAVRAVGAGVVKPEKLRGFLGLNREPFAELILDLLRRNALWINVHSGAFILPPDATQDDERAGAGLPSELRTLSLCYLSQLDVLTHRQNLWRNNYPSGWKVLPLGDVRRPEALTEFELKRAAARAVPRGLEIVEIVEVTSEPGVFQVDVVRLPDGAMQPGFVGVPRAGARWNRTDQDALDAALVEMRTIAPSLWDQIEQTSAPPQQRSLSRELAPVGGLPDLLAELQDSVHRTASPPTLLSTLERLIAVLDSRVVVSVAAGTSGVRQVMEAAMAAASESVAIASAFANETGARWLETCLGSRLNELTLGLSSGMETSLGEGESKVLRRLVGGLPALTKVSEVAADVERGAVSHAKFLIADGQALVVTTCNVLSAALDSEEFELGLAISGAGTRELIPDAARCLTQKALGTIHGPLTPNVSTEHVRVRREIERATELLSAKDATTLALGKDHVVERVIPLLKGELAGDFTSVHPVPTLHHRLCVLSMIEKATSWFLISSHRLSRFGFDDRMQSALNAALHERNLRVGVIWGELGEHGEEAIADLKQMNAASQGRVFFNEAPLPWHAKLVLADDRMSMVGSYEYLNLAASRTRAISEFSVLVHSGAVCSEIRRNIAEWCARSTSRSSVDGIFNSLIGSSG